MKLGNLLALDPLSPSAGLARGGKLEAEIWNEFADDPYRLHSIAEAIQASRGIKEHHVGYELDDEDFVEGRILTRIHRLRERNNAAVRRKKTSVIERTGKLVCEACNFDFEIVYGALGNGFAECHHTVPVSQLAEGQKTRIRDLAIVCSNCHRMIHRSRPMLAVEDLRDLIRAERISSS